MFAAVGPPHNNFRVASPQKLLADQLRLASPHFASQMAMRSRKLFSGGHDAFDAATQRLYHEMLDRERRSTAHLLANRSEPPAFGSTFGSTSSSLSSLSYLSSSSGGTGGLSHSLHRRSALGGSIRRLDESASRTPFGAALSLPSLPPLGGSTRSLPSLGSSRLSLDDDGDAPLPPPSRRRVLELPRLEERPVAFSWWAFTNPSPPARAEAPAVHR